MKVCFKCGIEKSIDSFYKHKGMKDGHLNKCIDCTKQDVDKREKELRKNPEFVKYEKARHREKYHRLGYKEKQKIWDKDKVWKNNSIYKNLNRKLKTPKGIELHHWCYKDRYLEDVVLMTVSDHRKLHSYLTLELNRRIFMTEYGELETKEKHLAFIKSVGLNYLEY